MHRNQLIPRRHHPVLAQIAQNDRKNCMESQLIESHRATRRSEFVHATVEDDLIGPGHIRSRSRSRTREATRRNGVAAGHRSSSSVATGSGSTGTTAATAMRSGLEISLPQRGRYIVVEDIRSNGSKKRSSTPEFVLVNKENGRAIPLHSLYQNPHRPLPLPLRTPSVEPPVDYDNTTPYGEYYDNDSDNTNHQYSTQLQMRRILQQQMRKARSTSDLSEPSEEQPHYHHHHHLLRSQKQPWQHQDLSRHSPTNSYASISSTNSPSLRKSLVYSHLYSFFFLLCFFLNKFYTTIA